MAGGAAPSRRHGKSNDLLPLLARRRRFPGEAGVGQGRQRSGGRRLSRLKDQFATGGAGHSDAEAVGVQGLASPKEDRVEYGLQVQVGGDLHPDSAEHLRLSLPPLGVLDPLEQQLGGGEANQEDAQQQHGFVLPWVSEAGDQLVAGVVDQDDGYSR